jgi:protein-histidine N-methyltransferase
LALFQWATNAKTSARGQPVTFILADYNPTVLQLVTLPNFIISWALQQATELPILGDALSPEGELELTEEVLRAFEDFLKNREVSLLFFSGAWSPTFVGLIKSAERPAGSASQRTVILGAETIYSPFALESFTETIFALTERPEAQAQPSEVFVAAKKLYFGVGGSLDDFVTKARNLGGVVETLREETEGVRRGVVRCVPHP